MSFEFSDSVLVEQKLKERPHNGYSTPQKQGDRRAGKKERITWTDRMFLRFMKDWWTLSSNPYFFQNSGKPVESGAKKTLEEMRYLELGPFRTVINYSSSGQSSLSRWIVERE